jgi:exopolysaccharide biosynthesis polyprenyl glycosylphosphotransferase
LQMKASAVSGTQHRRPQPSTGARTGSRRLYHERTPHRSSPPGQGSPDLQGPPVEPWYKARLTRSTPSGGHRPAPSEPRTLRSHARTDRLVAGCTLLFDGTLITLALLLAYYLRYVVRFVPTQRDTLVVSFRDWIPGCCIFVLVQLSCLLLAGAYRNRLGRDALGQISLICRTSLVGVGLVAVITAFMPVEFPSRLVLVYSWVLLILLVTCGRALLAFTLAHLYRCGWNTRHVVVCGTSSISRMVMQNLLTKQSHGYQLIGFVQEAAPSALSGPTNPIGADFGRFKCLGCLTHLDAIIHRHKVHEVIVALPASHYAEIAVICRHCEQLHVAVKLIPDLFELRLSRVRMDYLAGIPLIDVRPPYPRRIARLTKRGLDIVIASLVLMLAAPLLLLVAAAIKLDSPGPCLNRQQRIGKGGTPFTFYKLRSMQVQTGTSTPNPSIHRDPRIFKDQQDPRRTRVGRLIRRLSIDELPQLFNVLRDDMSLVGPRPPLPAEVLHYEPHHWKRLEVIGGLTGLWQVSGRSNIESFEEILLMDAYYIDNWSLLLDLKILLRTIVAVVTREGAY